MTAPTPTEKTPTEKTPAEIIDFWYSAGSEKWFKKSDAFDAEIRTRFGAAVEAAAAGKFDHWQDNPDGVLGLILLLDQFTRNINRDDPKTWAFDGRAQQISMAAIERGFDLELTEDRRRWLYMPFMHAEDLALQNKCIELAPRTSSEGFEKYARHHAEIIERFGRFPHRNALLGRESTPDEIAYLDDDGFKG